MDFGGVIGLMALPDAMREEIFIQGPLKMELLLHADYKKGHPVKIFYQFAEVEEQNFEVLEMKEKVHGPFFWDYLIPDAQCNVRCDSGTQQIPAVSLRIIAALGKIR